MTALRKIEPMHVEAFLAFCEDRPDDERWELFGGVPVMMTNPRRRHGTIAANLVMTIGPKARQRGCEIFAGDIKVRDPANPRFAAIPDIAIRCGPRGPDSEAILTDPVILIEILSPSTKARDLADKFLAYTAMASLQTYVILYQDEVRAEVWQRREGADPQDGARGWDNVTLTRHMDAFDLPVITAQMTLAQVYEGTELASIG